ncbi:ankyrin repeat-containing domain protein [Tirmania nivea]|nr:ankyrin repeat-containing domain protein [Tirmania nivea]
MPPWFTTGFGKSGGDGGVNKSPAEANDPAEKPREGKRERLLQLFKPQSRCSSPNPPSSSLQQAAQPIRSTNESDNLWTKAYHQLPPDLKQQLDLKEPEDADKLQTLQNVLQSAMQEQQVNMAKRLKLKWGDKEIDVQDTADRLVGWIMKFKEVGDIVVQYDPVHAALPWAGVRFILLLAVAEREKLAAAIVGMERIAVLIGRCAIYEQLYLTSNIPENAKEATENLRRGLVTLYTAILLALCRLIRVFKGKFIDKLKTSESTLAEIMAIDGPESAVSLTVIAVENCYSSATREYTKEEFCKLQERLSEKLPEQLQEQFEEQLREQLRKLLKDFMPVISTIHNNVDKIFKDIEENKRITILQWFSTVPYQSHHDLACEGRVENTGAWLFKRKEFAAWENSEKASTLWLHGIPGAGKTKLVSATIEYLSGIGKFDKVAFFYCKRDEADRRDRGKILLSLIKQLACPPMDIIDRGGYTRICAAALDAYNAEQKDPASRRQLNFDSSLKLLGQLVECFGHPVVVLDALDECSEDVRGELLRGLLSIIRKSKCPFKVFIASRHNLDIENNLHDLPHVCIEARDNAEDIENYVRQQLTLRIQNKRLLQGNVPQELSKCIEDVILRGANGMFLWVDWQLRELCKLMRESDIRARLGRLPKGLTGVYNEIMNSVKFDQPDCNSDLALRALKWMLVSKRPLEPRELIAAAELNPSTSVGSSASFQQSTLGVELLIESCRGLLLLDTKLDVVRFSHLSVQEYLETQNEIWNVSVIDAQLFVSESCLWTLQVPLESPLYEYAAHNWFRHCRSYQDLVVSVKHTKHRLSIPLLDSFFGSFKQASASYVKWTGRIRDDRRYHSLQAAPQCPVFSAAFAGLGELVSWLWDSQGKNMKINNNNGDSLLQVASRYGTEWIVTEMLKGDFEVDDVQNALYPASGAGKFHIVTLVLDRGADVNLSGGHYGSALGAAANKGSLEIVTLLLDRGADVNLSGGMYGTALGAAANKGNLEIVTLLLDRGADVNLSGGHYGSALGAAANKGSLEIVTLLLDRGADVNLSGGMYGTALGAAANEGSLEIVTLLLDRGADVNLSGGMHGTALGAAANEGSLEIVTLLLDRGADVNLPGGVYRTALGAAAGGYKPSLEIVTLLLDRGADVNLSGGHYGTALGAAANKGSLEIVTLLLDRGAGVNLPGGDYGTALGAAAGRYEPSLEIVTLFLDRGADVNFSGGRYGTALGAAANEGSLEIVTLLLDRGADVNVSGGRYGTALGAAAKKGSLEIVTLLLDRGADVNLSGGHYGTALGAAANEGSLEIVTLLLDRGADVNLSGGHYGTALGAAANEGSLEIVTLLLDRGTDVNLPGGDYGTVLGAAAGRYEPSLEIVTLFLDRGADVNFSGGRYGTALGAAANKGSLEIVTLLLDRGADINLPGGDYGTALGAAAGGYKPSLEIVTLLLDRGADVNLPGGDYGTALGAAAGGYKPSLEIVTLLLDRGADVNLPGGDYGTALGAAAGGYKPSLEIVTLLLDRGADVNLPGGDYGTALGAAAGGYKPSLEIVTLLLDQGADVNLSGGKYGTALGAAANKGSLEIVTLFLDRGADINLPGGDYGTALGAAAGRYEPSLEIVTLFLDRGMDVNFSGGRYGTALGAAANKGSLEIVTLLLDRGADVILPGGDYGTALGAAAGRYEPSLEIVTLLLDRGADVNVSGGKYGTALGAAAKKGSLEIVTLLLDRGADVNLSGGKYGTALGAAVYRKNASLETVS